MADEGLRVEFRMTVSHAPEQRFDVDGNELLQIRGRVVDSRRRQPEVVVRYAGQHQAQLARWCAPGKHLSVVGLLEVKTWTNGSQPCLALLVEASDVHPLNPDEPNHTQAGVHAALGRTSKVAPVAGPGKSDLRRALADA
jgi:hypothetical protein